MTMTDNNWYKDLGAYELKGIYAMALLKDGTVMYGRFDSDGYMLTKTGRHKVLHRYGDFPWHLDCDGDIEELRELLDPKGWDWVDLSELEDKPLDGYEYAVAINGRVYRVHSYSKFLESLTIEFNGANHMIPRGFVSGCYKRKISNGVFQDCSGALWYCRDSDCRLLAGSRIETEKTGIHSGMPFKEVAEKAGPLTKLNVADCDWDYFPADL